MKITFSHRKNSQSKFDEQNFALEYMANYSKEKLEFFLKQNVEKISQYQRKTILNTIEKDIYDFTLKNKRASDVELAKYILNSFSRFWKSHAQEMLEIIDEPHKLTVLSSYALWAKKNSVEDEKSINSILFPGVTNIDEALSLYKMYNDDKESFEPLNLIFIESKTAEGYYLADNIIDVANDVANYKKITDHSGEDVPRNARIIAEKLMNNEHTMNIVKPFLDEEIQLKNKYGEPSKQISQEAMNKLYKLAVSGSTYEADRPDSSGQVTLDNDDALVELLKFLDKLKKEDESSWYSLTRFQSTGSPGSLHSRLPSLLNAGDCLGSYKRHLAKFLYENSNLDLKSKANLLAKYRGYPGGNNNSSEWIVGSLELEGSELKKESFTGIMREEIEEDLGKKSFPRSSIREVIGQLSEENPINKTSLYKEKISSLKIISKKEEVVNQSSCKC